MNELITRLITLFDRLQQFGEAKATPLYNEAVGAMIQQRFLAMVFDVSLTMFLAALASIAAIIIYRFDRDKNAEETMMVSIIVLVISLFILTMQVPHTSDSIVEWLQAYHYPNVTFLKTLK